MGSYGVAALGRLLSLMLGFYLTATLFVVLVLGTIARVAGFSIFRFLGYIKEEILLVLGTSSSETALPGMMEKMRLLGCAESTVGFVIPTGYSFNLDGTNIYDDGRRVPRTGHQHAPQPRPADQPPAGRDAHLLQGRQRRHRRRVRHARRHALRGPLPRPSPRSP